MTKSEKKVRQSIKLNKLAADANREEMKKDVDHFREREILDNELKLKQQKILLFASILEAVRNL